MMPNDSAAGNRSLAQPLSSTATSMNGVSPSAPRRPPPPPYSAQHAIVRSNARSINTNDHANSTSHSNEQDEAMQAARRRVAEHQARLEAAGLLGGRPMLAMACEAHAAARDQASSGRLERKASRLTHCHSFTADWIRQYEGRCWRALMCAAVEERLAIHRSQRCAAANSTAEEDRLTFAPLPHCEDDCTVCGDAAFGAECDDALDSTAAGDEGHAADHAVIALPCGHCFHKACVMPWIRVKAACPNCRHQIRRLDVETRAFRARFADFDEFYAFHRDRNFLDALEDRDVDVECPSSPFSPGGLYRRQQHMHLDRRMERDFLLHHHHHHFHHDAQDEDEIMGFFDGEDFSM